MPTSTADFVAYVASWTHFFILVVPAIDLSVNILLGIL